MKKTGKKEFVIILLVLLQIGFLLVFNMLRMNTMVNMDSSEYLVQVIQIVRQRTLLIEDYYYSTALMWDMPTLLAVPFYALTGNIFLSWGLSVNVHLILLAIVVYRLCTHLGHSIFSKWLSLLAIFTIYNFGLVDYADTMLVNGATYVVRIMLMLLFIDVVICSHKDERLSAGNVILYVIALAGIFVCGISTGMFELGCCIFPILMYEMWFTFRKKTKLNIRDFFRKPLILSIIGVVAVGMGMLVNRLLGLPQSQETAKLLLSVQKMPRQFGYNLLGILQLFGWPAEETLLLSGAGIMALFALAVSVIWCLIFGIGTIRAFKGWNNGKPETESVYGGIVFFVFVVNLTLFSVVQLSYGGSTFEYRYWLVLVIPAFLEIGVAEKWMKENLGINFQRLIVVGIMLILSLINIKNDRKIWGFGEWVSDTVQENEDIMNLVADTDIDTLFVYSDFYRSRILCAHAPKDIDAFAVTMNAEDGHGNWTYNQLSMPRWGNYVKYDGDCLQMPKSCRGGIILDTAIGYDSDFLMARAARQIPLKGSELVLLIMETNYMDFVQGIPVGEDRSRDYFNQGYEIANTVVNEKGLYQAADSSKGTLIAGTFEAKTEGNFDLKLKYEVKECRGTAAGVLIVSVECANGQSKRYEISLEAGATEVSQQDIEIDKGDSYSICINQTEGTVLALDFVEWTR